MVTLYCGDNLDILRRCIADESIGVSYLDPPFNSGQSGKEAEVTTRQSSSRP